MKASYGGLCLPAEPAQAQTPTVRPRTRQPVRQTFSYEEPALALRDLSFGYDPDRPVLRGVTFTVPRRRRKPSGIPTSARA